MSQRARFKDAVTGEILGESEVTVCPTCGRGSYVFPESMNDGQAHHYRVQVVEDPPTVSPFEAAARSLASIEQPEEQRG